MFGLGGRGRSGPQTGIAGRDRAGNERLPIRVAQDAVRPAGGHGRDRVDRVGTAEELPLQGAEHRLRGTAGIDLNLNLLRAEHDAARGGATEEDPITAAKVAAHANVGRRLQGGVELGFVAGN